MKTPFANRFLNFHERSEIWRNINNNEDVLNQFNSARSLISYMSKFHSNRLGMPDIEEMQKTLPNIELAIKKVEELPNLFTFTDEEIVQLKENYNDLDKQINDIYMRMTCWD